MSKRTAIITIFLFLIIVIILMMAVFWSTERMNCTAETADIKVSAEPSVSEQSSDIVPIPGDMTTPNPDGEKSVTMNYSLDAELSQTNSVINLYFQNPNSSNHDVSLELVVIDGNGEIVIAESELIKPGFQLLSIPLDTNSAVLGKGVYNAKYRVSFFDSVTGEKSQVSSEITDVTLTVTD